MEGDTCLIDFSSLSFPPELKKPLFGKQDVLMFINKTKVEIQSIKFSAAIRGPSMMRSLMWFDMSSEEGKEGGGGGGGVERRGMAGCGQMTTEGKMEEDNVQRTDNL